MRLAIAVRCLLNGKTVEWIVSMARLRHANLFKTLTLLLVIGSSTLLSTKRNNAITMKNVWLPVLLFFFFFSIGLNCPEGCMPTIMTISFQLALVGVTTAQKLFVKLRPVVTMSWRPISRIGLCRMSSGRSILKLLRVLIKKSSNLLGLMSKVRTCGPPLCAFDNSVHFIFLKKPRMTFRSKKKCLLAMV